MRKNGVQTLAVDGVAGVLPASTTTVYSDRFLMADLVKIGLSLTAAGTGVDILVKLRISNDDDEATSAYQIEDGYSDIVNLTNTTRSKKTIHDGSIPAAKYGVLSFTGQNANPADAAVTGTIDLIRDIGN